MENFFKKETLYYETPRVEVLTISSNDVIRTSPEQGGEWGDGGDSWDIFG